VDAALYPIPCVSVGIEPVVKVEASAELEFSFTLSDTSGFSFETKRGIKSLSSSLKPDLDVKVEGKVFVGLDLQPQVEILEGKLAEFVVEMPIGLEFVITRTGNNGAAPSEKDESYHDCEHCLDTEVFFKIEIEVKLKFLNLEKLTIERLLRSLKFSLGHFYYSFDNKDLGWGTCPNVSYRLTVSVVDQEGSPMAGTAITTGDKQLQTNEKGVVICFLPRAVHSVTCNFGESDITKKVVMDRAQKLKFTEGETPTPDNSFGEDAYFGTLDDSVIIA